MASFLGQPRRQRDAAQKGNRTALSCSSSALQRDVLDSSNSLADTRDGQDGNVDRLQQAGRSGSEQCARQDPASGNTNDQKVRADALEDAAEFSR